MADILKRFVATWDYVPVTVRNLLAEDYFDAVNENREIEPWVVHEAYDDLSDEVHLEDCAVNECIYVINQGMNNGFIRSVMQRWLDKFHDWSYLELKELRRRGGLDGVSIKYEILAKVDKMDDDEKTEFKNKVMQSMFVRDEIASEGLRPLVKEACDLYNEIYNIGVESMVWGGTCCPP